MSMLITLLVSLACCTPLYELTWTGLPAGSYADVYIGARGAETLAAITLGQRVAKAIPAGQCAYVQATDQHNVATGPKSSEVCPSAVPIPNPPVHVLVTKR